MNHKHIAILITLLITAFLGLFVFSSKGRYSLQHNQPNEFIERYFKQTLLKNLATIHYLANENDTLCNIVYNKKFGIVLWKIKTLDDIDLNSTTVTKNSFNNRDYYFTFYSGLELSLNCELNYKIPENWTNALDINISEGKELMNPLINAETNYFYIESSKIGISSKNARSNIVFKFNKKNKKCNLFLTKKMVKLV